MDTITKTELRKKMCQDRIAMSREEFTEKNLLITQNVLLHPAILSCKTLLLYSDIRNEVRTHDIYENALSRGISVAYPRVIGDLMHFYTIKSDDDLETGYMGILEPIITDENPVRPDNGVILVPGTVFDLKGNRFGYGKGYYDRYLSAHSNLLRIGLAYDFQVLDEIDPEAHDVPLDYIITERRIIKNDRFTK